MADPEDAAAAAPAASQKQSRCSGYKQGDDTVECVFSPAFPGTAAFPHGGKCVFCCPERMQVAVQDWMKKKHLVAALNKFKGNHDEVYLLAVGRLRSHLATEQFKAAVTPKNRCIGMGDQLCTRSANGDGGPAWAGKGRALCSACEKETRDAEAAKRLAEMETRLADACGRLEASRVQDMLSKIDVAEYCQDSVRQELVQDIIRELPSEIFEVTLDTAARAALRSPDWNPYRYKSLRLVLMKVLGCMEKTGGAADAQPLIRLRPVDDASALREALAAWPARDAAATLIQGTALERTDRRELMKVARSIAEALPEGVAFAMKDSDGNSREGLRAAALDADRAHQMNREAVKTELLGMLLETLDKYPDAVALQNHLVDVAKTHPVHPAPDCRLTRRLGSILWRAADEARRKEQAKKKAAKCARKTGALAAPPQPAAPRPELPAAEAAAPAAEAAAAAEPPAAEAAAPAAAAAAPPAAAAAAAAEAQASDPRPPFDAASSPPFKCFYLDCTATQNTYLGLMRRLKAKHCKVVSDFDGTFFADQVRAQKAEENDSRIARAAESAEAAAGASAAGASGAAPPARPATQARARVSQRAAAAGVVSKVKQELAEEENAEEGKMNAPVGRLQLLPRPPPQIFVHADQPKRKQLTLEQTIGFSRSLATDEKQRPAAAGEPPVAAREPHVKVCQDDQASIWAYQSVQRHGSKHFPLTEKAMKFLVSEYRARYGAATTAPNNTDMTEIIAKGQMEEVKCLGEEVVVDQVRNFYRQFLKLAAARSSHPAPRTA